MSSSVKVNYNTKTIKLNPTNNSSKEYKDVSMDYINGNDYSKNAIKNNIDNPETVDVSLDTNIKQYDNDNIYDNVSTTSTNAALKANVAYDSSKEFGKSADKLNSGMFVSSFYKFPDFKECLNGKHVKLPDFGKKWIPQGCCEANGYTLITAYDSSSWDSREPSVIYVLDNNGNLVNTVSLDGKMHCGGISYDQATGSVYVTGKSGTESEPDVSYVNRYSIADILSGEKNVKALDKFKVDNTNSLKSSTNERSSAAYLTVANGCLYVGNFSTESSRGIIKVYTLNSDGSLGSCKVLKNPNPNTQGMCVYNYNGKDYYLFSCSYGRHKNSKLVVSIPDGHGGLINVGEIDMPCMSEQINVTDDGIAVIFESSATKYSSSNDKADDVVDEVCYLSFEDILDKI